jgi:hypothetical protein
MIYILNFILRISVLNIIFIKVINNTKYNNSSHMHSLSQRRKYSMNVAKTLRY